MKSLLIVLWALQAGGAAKPEPDVRNESYGPHARNVLDLWKAKSEAPVPLVLFIHGGGFRAGSKEGVSPSLIRDCLAAGLSVASINYRLTDTAPFPAPMHDGALAVQHLRHHKEKHGLNGKIACTGGSAGAGISLWLAFHEDLAVPDHADPVRRQSTRISTALGTGAQCSYDPRFIKRHIGGLAHEHPALKPFYALADGEAESEKAYRLYEEASPITHLTKDDPPVMVTYGGNDPPSETKPGAGIHHENFGFVLREAMKKLDLACEVQVGRSGGVSAVDWFKRHLLK